MVGPNYSDKRAATTVQIGRMMWSKADGVLKRVPDYRPRCVKDDKVVFRTAADAAVAADKITQRGQPMKHYLGKCGHWHLARIKK
jgi:hypothetical protein